MRRKAMVAALAAWGAMAGAALSGSVPLGDDGLHKPDWLKDSFRDVREDAAEAAAAGRVLMLLVEQRGCIYCAELHETVLTDPRIDRLIRERFDVVQIDLFGGTDVTDSDGEVLSEKRMAGKWGVTVTPTLMLMPATIPEGVSAPRAAMAVVPGVLDAERMLALLDWAAAGGPGTGRTLREVLRK